MTERTVGASEIFESVRLRSDLSDEQREMAGVFALALARDPTCDPTREPIVDHTWGDDFLRPLVNVKEDFYAPLLAAYDREVESRGLSQDVKEVFLVQEALLGIANKVLQRNDPEARAWHRAAETLRDDARRVKSVHPPPLT